MSLPSKIERLSFSKIGSKVELPNLLNLQVDSWKEFLQEAVATHERDVKGLEAIFQAVFPIEDNHGNYKLDYVSYSIGLPRYSIEECLERGVTYSVPLKVKVFVIG